MPYRLYSTMQAPDGAGTPLTKLAFTGGTKCWNVVCGEATALGSIEEPSTCVYSATLVTPIACGREAASELHDEL